MANRLPKLPGLLQRKLYKTGQTRGADDDVIYQNRVNRNSTVLIPLAFYDTCAVSPDEGGEYERGFIVLVKPEDYFDNAEVQVFMRQNGLSLGTNSLLVYETRDQWSSYNPKVRGLIPATSRENPLGGHYVARVPSTTRSVDEKISIGFNTSGQKGAGIRVYEYASSETIEQCRDQLEYVFWRCVDADEVAIDAGMSAEKLAERQAAISERCEGKDLASVERLTEARIIDADGHAACPLCLEKLSANGFLNRLKQAEGRDVPDLTVTQINLFHIRELRTGEFNHRPYNLGWGHHHCNVVCKDSGIEDTLNWMREIISRNQ